MVEEVKLVEAMGKEAVQEQGWLWWGRGGRRRLQKGWR